MTSLAWQHHQRIRAEKAAAALREQLMRQEAGMAAETAQNNAAFELLLVELDNTLKALHDIPQGEARREQKKRALLQFMPTVEAYLAAGSEFQNPVLIWCLVWSVDVGDMAGAARLAEAAMALHLTMPPPFKSGYTVKMFWADAVLEWAESQYKANRSVNPYFPDAFAAVLDYPVHDIVKAKFCKLAAKLAKDAGDYAEALRLTERAEQYGGDKAQVKTLKAELVKLLAAAAEEARHASPSQE